MQADKNKPADAAPGQAQGGKQVQADAQSDVEPREGAGGSVRALRKAAEDLKAKIADAKRRNDAPINSALGNPGWERSVADGHIDLPDEEDEA